MAVEFDDDSAAPAGNGSVVFDDENPSFLEKTAGNIIPDLKQTAKGLGDMASGPAVDIMSGDVASALPKLAKEGKDFFSNPVENAKAMARPITHPIDYFEEHPVQQTLNAAGAVAGLNELRAPDIENLPRGTPPPEVPPETPPAVVPMPPEAPKGLPIVEPGAKTGDPHALFAYNDKFGPGGADRSVYNVFGDPEHPNLKARGWGSSVPAEDLEAAGIPITGRQPNSTNFEPLPNIPKEPPPPTPPPPKADPLQDVKDWMASKGQKFAQKPGIVQKIGNYLDEESAKLGGKDIGLQLGQVKSMGPGFEGLEKGKALVSYAREKGYLDPSLSDTSRRTMVEQNMNKAGEQLGALRDIADKRGAPPVAAMRDQLKAQLEDKFGIDAPGEVNKVLAKFDKAAQTPTFSKMAKLATDLHAEATPATKMGLHPGPTTEGANILARMNNDATRATFNTEEGKMFTDSLRDFGAHKKLEQALAAGGRKALVGRGAPGSATNRLIQEGLDRGGYRLGGNIANKVAGWTKANPKATLPQFFEELAHQSDQSVDDAIQGFSKGGVVPNDVKQWVTSRGC
jgi:hypothetical protein